MNLSRKKNISLNLCFFVNVLDEWRNLSEILGESPNISALKSCLFIYYYTVCFCGNRCTNIDIHAYFDFCLVNLLLLLTWIIIKKLYCISQKMSKTIFKYFEYFFFIMSQSHIDKWIVYFIVRIRLAIFSAIITCNEVN